MKNFEQPNIEENPQIINSESAEQPKSVKSKKMSGLKKIGAAVVLGSSLLATGCSSEKQPIEKPEDPKVESKDGFTDNAHENVQRRLKTKKDEIKHMHENSRINK